MIGLIIAVSIFNHTRNEPECLIGKATLEPAGIAIVFGEAIVCGDEVIISDIYGPTIEAWSGEIKFNHNHD